MIKSLSMLAPSYIAMAVTVLINVLAYAGITVGSEALTTTIQTLITVGAGLYVMYRQVTTGRSTLAGMKPE